MKRIQLSLKNMKRDELVLILEQLADEYSNRVHANEWMTNTEKLGRCIGFNDGLQALADVIIRAR